jgi:hypothetical protein
MFAWSQMDHRSDDLRPFRRRDLNDSSFRVDVEGKRNISRRPGMRRLCLD